jgi:tRNA-2-methylthio-N6-dimethylallyladenosine synthase
MTDDVVDAIAEYPVLAKQIHLPIQSGDDKVLIRMNRNYRLGHYRSVVEKIRTTIPQASLFTDIIVGFTGETDEQFEATREAMREFAYNMAYIAMYSPRPGAKSARWEDDVPHEEKRRRLHELSAELQTASQRYNDALIGSSLSVLVEAPDRKDGYLSGKTEGKLIVRFPSDDRSLIGRFVTVSITSASALSLEGELVAEEPETLSASTDHLQRSHDAAARAMEVQRALVAQ